MFGGQEGMQKPMLPKIKALDVEYGLVASMDLAQNEQNHKKAGQLAEQAISEYPDSFLLVERAAQMQWTLDNDARAQQLFMQTCNLPAQAASDRMVWITSCYTVVYLSLNNDTNHTLAVTAMQRLLSVNTLKTAENDQAKLYLAEMAKKAGNKSLALATYRELAKESIDKKIRKKAGKSLKKNDLK
jgi:tetratricopeptide (TPR) repeat protein